MPFGRLAAVWEMAEQVCTMTETRLPSDLIDLLAVLADIGVQYLLNGGQV
jgi:hypothetical protein